MTTTNSPRISARRAALRQRFQVAAPDFFVQLGQLATDRGFARAQSGRKVGQRGGNPRPGLEQHDGGRHAREFGNARAARGLFGRQKAGEQKLIRGQARDRQGREHGRRPWQRRDRMARVLGGAHQLVSRIGNQRRAGVRHQGERRAVGEPLQQRRPRLRGIVVVVGRERRGDAVAVEQLAGYARVFTGNEVGAGQRG